MVLLTQDEPLFLAPSIEQLLIEFPSGCEMVACVVFDPSPIARKMGLLGRAKQLFKVFGTGFFLRYAAMFAAQRLRPSGGLGPVLKKYKVPEVRLANNINTHESLDQIRALKPDLLVSVAGNQIFRLALIDLAPKGCINLHTSLLPHYRGLMPTFWVLRFDEPETAVSVFFVDEGIDTGPLLVQERVPITTNRLETLIKQTKRLGMSAVARAIAKVRDGDVATTPNRAADGSYFGFPTRDDVRAFKAAGKRLY
ncbi:MAG: formyltransferase family protein [Sphingomicrobium sp.]